MPPYCDDNPAKNIPPPITPLHEIGVKRWQYDLWYKIISAEQRGEVNRVCLDYHPALQKPALSRYGSTSPALLRWMKHYNGERSYSQQVKPFGFLVSMTARSGLWAEPHCGTLVDSAKRGAPRKPHHPKPISPFERDGKKAAQEAFDRVSGEPVAASQLKSYAECLGQYHLSSEDKFENAEFTNRGLTLRRHVIVQNIELIGKEANQVGKDGRENPVIPSSTSYAESKKPTPFDAGSMI
jgi:hypothetical protein